MNPSRRPGTVLPVLWTGLGLAAVLAWDGTGLDLTLARLAGNGNGFPLRDHWLLSQVLHEGARRVAWLCVLALALAVGWPWGPMRAVPLGRRLQWFVSAIAAAALVALLKGASATSCPWDQQTFGGIAQPVSHWSPLSDGGPGHCFPAGHASAGYGFVGGYFALRDSHPRWAYGVLAASLVAGTVLGLAQQWRGAHFMSHTLWTAWLCWTTALALELAFRWDSLA